MQFLCTPTTQLVDQPCATLSSTIGSKIHHQRPQHVGFSHIGWLEFLPNSYKAKENSLVSCKHNRKLRGVWPTFISFLITHTPFKEMDQAWFIIMFQPLGMNQAQKKEKGLWGSKLTLLVRLRWLNWSVTPYWGEAWTWTPLHGCW